MQMSFVRCALGAGLVFSSALPAFTQASTSAVAQQVHSSQQNQPSIISVSPAIRPEGERLARSASESTFEHAPANYHVFATATAGEDTGVEQIRLNFAGETRLTGIVSKSKDFLVEPGGTCREGNTYKQGDSCSLVVRFDPQGPGRRLGHLEIANSAESAPLFVGLVGNGYAPVVSFTPSQISTVPASISAGAGTIKSATRLAIDGGDTLYIADTGNDLVKRMDSTGSILNSALGPISTPASLAADSFGILYTGNVAQSTYYFSIYYPWGSQTAFGYAYTSSTCTVAAPCTFSSVGMSSPANLSMDAYDNLFLEEGTAGAAEMPVAGISGGSGTLKLWHLSDQFSYSSGTPGSFAVDASGDLYTDYNYTAAGTCYLLEESLYDAEYAPSANRVAGGDACGFSGDGGQARSAEISSSVGQITFDAAGNLYFADSGNQRVRRIDYSTGIIHTIAGNGTAGYTGDSGPATAAELSSPTGLAVDSQGQVYVLSNAPSAGPTQVLRKIGQTGYLSFGSQAAGSAVPVQTVLVSNTGNSVMTLNSAVIKGANSGDFAVDPSTTCNLTAGATLASGRSCQIGILFTPKALGVRTANLVLFDNTVLGADTVILTGTEVLSTPTLKITSPAAGASFASGSSVTFKVTVTGVGGVPAPTGTIQFKVDGKNQGGAVAIASGAASTTLTGLSSATHTLAASYSGDVNYNTGTAVSESITIKAAAAAPTQVKLARATTIAQSCSAAAFVVSVASNSVALPTGKVELLSGAKVLASGPLVNGKITIKTNLSAIGKSELVAHYFGDAHHLPGNSAELKVTTTKTAPCEVK